MTETIPNHIKADDVVELDKEPPAQAIKFEKQSWTCPVCGLYRSKGNHQECVNYSGDIDHFLYISSGSFYPSQNINYKNTKERKNKNKEQNT